MLINLSKNKIVILGAGLLEQRTDRQDNTYENNNYARFFSPLRFNDDDMMREISQYPSGQL